MPELKSKMVFLAGASTSINSRVKARLATKFREDGLEWLVRVVIKGKFRWHVRTSQEKSYLFVPQVVQKAKGVTQAAQCVERSLRL